MAKVYSLDIRFGLKADIGIKQSPSNLGIARLICHLTPRFRRGPSEARTIAWKRLLGICKRTHI